jgi:outer membrane lipoprotein carrier protein
MKKFFAVFLLFFSASYLFAQGSNSLDPQAEKLLADISRKYKQFKTAKVELDLLIDIPETDDDENLKVISWLSGDKFRIELDDQIFISDNVYIWNYMKSYNEVQINHFDGVDAIFSPSVIFNMYSSDYIYRTKEEFRVASGKSFKVIELTPTDKSKDFFKIDLTINTTDMEITRLKIYEKSGIHYIYNIKKFTPNIPLAADFFTFKVEDYKGVKVSDLR